MANSKQYCFFCSVDLADLALLIREQNSRVVSGLLLLADESRYIRHLLRRCSLHLFGDMTVGSGYIRSFLDVRSGLHC